MKNQIKMYLFTILYLICRKLNGYSEEINKSKYLTLVPTN